MWFLFGQVSSSSGCLGWATLFYCGTPCAFHIVVFQPRSDTTCLWKYLFTKKGQGSLYGACSRLDPLPETPHFYMVKLGVIRDIYIVVVLFL